MAEKLGIEGYLDLGNITESINKLGSMLGNLGIDFAKTSEKVTASLKTIADATDKSAKQKLQEMVEVLRQVSLEAELSLSAIPKKAKETQQNIDNTTKAISRLQEELKDVPIGTEKFFGISNQLENQKTTLERYRIELERLRMGYGTADAMATVLGKTLTMLMNELEKESEITDETSHKKEDIVQITEKEIESEKELQQELGQTNKELEQVNQTYDNTKDSVDELSEKQGKLNEKIDEMGDKIEKVNTKKISTQINEAREKLVEMIEAGEMGTPEFRELAIEVGELKTQMSLANAQINYFANPSRHLDAVKQGFQGVAGAASLITGTLGLFNAESEKMAEIQTRIQSLLGVIVGLETTYNAIKQTSNLMLGVQELQTIALAKAKDLEAASTIKATVAQRAFNLVAKANPYILLASAVITVVGAIALYTSGMKKKREEEEKSKKAMEELKQAQDEWKKEVSNSVSSQLASYKTLQARYKELGGDLKKQEEFIKSNKSEFDKLGVSVKSVTDAENLFIQNENAFVSSLNHRARAAATLTLLQDQYKNLITAELNQEEYLSDDSIKNKAVMNANAAFKKKYGERYGAYLSGLQSTYQKGGTNPNVDITKEMQDYYNRAMEVSLKGFALQRAKEEAGVDEKKIQELTNTYLKDLNASAEVLKKAGILENDDKKTANTMKTDNTEKELEKRRKLLQEITALELQNQQSEINLMQDGSAKRLAQLDLEYKKELQKIDEQREQVAKEQGRSLNNGENAVFDQAEELALKKYQQSIRQEAEETARAEREAMTSYLAEYGDYQEKRKAISEQYAQRIADAETEGEKLSLQKQMEAALQGLDFEQLKSTLNLSDVFGSNLERQTLGTLDALRQKLQEYINTQNELTPENIKELQEALDNLDEEIRSRSPFKKAEEDIRAYVNASKNVKLAEKELQQAQDTGGVSVRTYTDENGELKEELYTVEDAEKRVDQAHEERRKAMVNAGLSISSVGAKLGQFSNAAKSIGNTLEQDFGVKLGDGLNEAIDGFGQLSDGVSNFGEALASGNVAGAIAGVVQSVGAIVKMGEGIGKALGFGSDWSSYNRMLAEYEKLNTVWDEIISKKKEYLGMSYGDEALRVGEEALNVARQSIQSNYTLGRELLNTGASVGSHSIGVRQRKNISDEGWAQLRSAAADIGFNYNSVAEGRMLGLFDLTAKQLEQLQEKAPVFWAKLDDNVREYLENIIAGEERLEEIQELLKEQITGTTFDKVTDGFFDMLSDMSKGTQDFTTDVNEMLFNAFVNQRLRSKYEGQLQEWYDMLYNATASDGLDEKEIKDLREQYKAIAEAALAERDTIAQLTGYGTSSNPDQQATYNSLEKWTYDQADELISRATAMQIIQQHQYERLEELGIMQATMVQDVSSLRQSTLNIDANMSELVSIQRNSLRQLEGIKANTDPIGEIADELTRVRRLIEQQ